MCETNQSKQDWIFNSMIIFRFSTLAQCISPGMDVAKISESIGNYLEEVIE
jgi:hypothetical protein